MVISSRLRSMRPSRMLAFTLISYHLENVRESCAFKKGVSLIEINRANPLSRLFSTLLERVRGIGSCRFTTSKVSLWQILLQNDFERVVTKLLFKEAMDDARLFQVVRLLDSGAPLGFDCRAFVIVRLDRRDLVWINVTENPIAEWIARQITEAFPWDDARNTSFVIGIGKIG